MTNRFYWKTITHYDKINDLTFNSLSVLEQLDDDSVRFWASINLEKKNGKYQFASFSKDRILHSVPEHQYTEELQDAKFAVMDYLISEGIIHNYGDVEEADGNFLLPKGFQIV